VWVEIFPTFTLWQALIITYTSKKSPKVRVLTLKVSILMAWRNLKIAREAARRIDQVGYTFRKTSGRRTQRTIRCHDTTTFNDQFILTIQNIRIKIVLAACRKNRNYITDAIKNIARSALCLSLRTVTLKAIGLYKQRIFVPACTVSERI